MSHVSQGIYNQIGHIYSTLVCRLILCILVARPSCLSLVFKKNNWRKNIYCLNNDERNLFYTDLNYRDRDQRRRSRSRSRNRSDRDRGGDDRRRSDRDRDRERDRGERDSKNGSSRGDSQRNSRERSRHSESATRTTTSPTVNAAATMDDE